MRKTLVRCLFCLVALLTYATTTEAQNLNFDALTETLKGEYRYAVQTNDIQKLEKVKAGYVKLTKLSWGEKDSKKLQSLINDCDKQITRIKNEAAQREKERKQKIEEEKAAKLQREREAAEAKRLEEERIAREAYEAERRKTARIEVEANGVKFTVIRVDKGEFQMGATPNQPNPEEDEKPAHTVRFDYEYYMGETEVTQALWEAVMGSNPSAYQGALLPVESVSWDECQIFIEKLNQLTGKTFRLPTEQEWEYAARGGAKNDNTVFSGSNDIDDVAWAESNSNGTTQQVKTKQPNGIGLYDMTGNVWEWCINDFNKRYPTSAVNAIVVKGRSEERCVRGGSYYESEVHQRVSFRNSLDILAKMEHTGLRLVMEMPKN